MAHIEGRYLVCDGSNVQVKLPWRHSAEQLEVSRRRLLWLVEHPGKTYPLQLQEEMLKCGIGSFTRSKPNVAPVPSPEVCHSGAI